MHSAPAMRVSMSDTVDKMTDGFRAAVLSLGWLLESLGWVQTPAPGAYGAGLGGLPTGLGGGGVIPGAIPITLIAEVHRTACTLGEMGREAAPGDPYEVSLENSHMIMKLSRAALDIAWQMLGRHKLFLAPGGQPELPQRLMDESQVGKQG